MTSAEALARTLDNMSETPAAPSFGRCPSQAVVPCLSYSHVCHTILLAKCHCDRSVVVVAAAIEAEALLKRLGDECCLVEGGLELARHGSRGVSEFWGFEEVTEDLHLHLLDGSSRSRLGGQRGRIIFCQRR